MSPPTVPPITTKERLENVLALLKQGAALDELPDGYRTEREAIRRAAFLSRIPPIKLLAIDVITELVFAADNTNGADSPLWRDALTAFLAVVATIGALSSLISGVLWILSAQAQLHSVDGTSSIKCDVHCFELLSAKLGLWAAYFAAATGIAAVIATFSFAALVRRSRRGTYKHEPTGS